MNLNQPTLVLFDYERSRYEYFPPDQSDSFYTIGESNISIYTNDKKLHIVGIKGNINVGHGKFTFSTELYNGIEIHNEAALIINDELEIDNTNIFIYGTLIMEEGSKLILRRGATILFSRDSYWDIRKNCSIIIEDGCEIMEYGDVDIDVNLMKSIIEDDKINLDSACNVVATNIDLGEREFSLTDYDQYLRKIQLNMYTQGEYNVQHGRIGYTWKGGHIDNKSQQLEMTVLYGSTVLGDFKLKILGEQASEIPNKQILRSIHIVKNSILYIEEEYNGYDYIRPELYLGVVIDNVLKPASALVEGMIIVDGNDALITLDRNATMTIAEGGSIYLKNGANMKSTNNEQTVLYINGQLIVDSIEQIKTFKPENIKFGEKGKLVVLNPANEHTLLFSTPNGKYHTDLYRIFKNYMDHIEYHISPNSGIAIDQFFDYYSRDMVDWFAGRRIEKAIYDGILVWEDGAFIELDQSIIPWATLDASLYQATRLFKSFASRDIERIKDVAARLKYAGCGNITFRFIQDDKYKDIVLHLEGTTPVSVTNMPASDEYNITVDNDGSLFMKNQVADASEDIIIAKDSKMTRIYEGSNYFDLK